MSRHRLPAVAVPALSRERLRMEWLNLHTSTLDSEEFLCSDPVDQATWLKLERYCIGQENGGVIHRARNWTDR